MLHGFLKGTHVVYNPGVGGDRAVTSPLSSSRVSPPPGATIREGADVVLQIHPLKRRVRQHGSSVLTEQNASVLHS